MLLLFVVVWWWSTSICDFIHSVFKNLAHFIWLQPNANERRKKLTNRHYKKLIYVGTWYFSLRFFFYCLMAIITILIIFTLKTIKKWLFERYKYTRPPITITIFMWTFFRFFRSLNFSRLKFSVDCLTFFLSFVLCSTRIWKRSLKLWHFFTVRFLQPAYDSFAIYTYFNFYRTNTSMTWLNKIFEYFTIV